jgi:predicted nuclease with TOPRIM domain
MCIAIPRLFDETLLTTPLVTGFLKMAPQVYGGPTALTHSKYASSSIRKAQLATVPAAVSSVNTVPVNTIATKEQIAASRGAPASEAETQNLDVQLAVAQGNALKEAVDKHSAKISNTVSSSIVNTRKILQVIRAAVHKEDPTALQSVDHLWVELEQIYEAAQGANSALPDFLEKQRNNMALYHGSVMNETYRDSQAELNLQNKKINLQHGLILEHQQAFQDYKAQTASKLRQIEELKERVSRLVLEKGNYRDEIDKYAQLLEQEQATKAEELKKASALQDELTTLATSKNQLLAEIEDRAKTIRELQEKMQATEHKANERFNAELGEKTDLLTKETAKVAGLNTLVATLKGHESTDKKELAKLNAEVKLLNEKYTRMATEHAEAFSVSLLSVLQETVGPNVYSQKAKEQTKMIETLTAETERLRKENTDLKQRLVKLSDLEETSSSLIKEKSDLLEQIGKLSKELTATKDNIVKISKESTALKDNIGKVQKDYNDLKAKNSELLSEQASLQAESEDAIQAIQTASDLSRENTKLKALVERLQAGQVVSTGDETGAVHEKIQALEEQKNNLEAALKEWTSLAKVSTPHNVIQSLEGKLTFDSVRTVSTKTCSRPTSRPNSSVRPLWKRMSRSKLSRLSSQAPMVCVRTAWASKGMLHTGSTSTTYSWRAWTVKLLFTGHQHVS